MLYFDTSFLVPLFLEEPTSANIERFVRSRTEELAVSHWTRIEFSSALAREVRMGGLDRDAAAKADAQFEALVSKSFKLLSPSAEDFELSKRYLSHYESGLRAGDALHLAIASNHRANAIYTLDNRLSKAGRQFGLTVNSGIRLPRTSP